MEYASRRLIFREFTDLDFSLYYSIFSNAQVMKYTLMDPFKSEEEALPYYQRILSNNKEILKRSAYEFGVFLSMDKSFIGFADIMILFKNDFGGCGEIGYFLLPCYWGYGYATEISKTLINISFKELNLHKVSARCNSNNLHSENVMKKAGMIKEGEIRKVRYKNGHWDNELQYGIVKEDWDFFNN
ncbi:MAG: GNAT family N-acetyltransferase [Clostridia bacterium]|nr:GNAT family N-acetyltransferase [Clostridia bacterium]